MDMDDVLDQEFKKQLLGCTTLAAQGNKGKVKEVLTLETSKHEEGRSWLPPHSEPGTTKPSLLPSAPVRIYYPDSYQAPSLTL